MKWWLLNDKLKKMDIIATYFIKDLLLFYKIAIGSDFVKLFRRFLILFFAAIMVFQNNMFGVSAGINANPKINKPDTINHEIIPIIKAPSNLTSSSPEIGKVVLHWTDNSSNESGFNIERKSSSDDSFFQIDYVGANVTSYEQSELSTYAVFPGEDYYYRVKAFNSSTSSSYSNESYVQVMNNMASPSAPAALRAKAMWDMGHWVLRLFWVDTSDNEDKFVVQKETAAGGFTVLKELPANTVKYDQNALDLERNVKLTYRVVAYNAGGAGVSNTVDITLPDGSPATPAFNQPLGQGSTSILLSWTDNSDNEDYFRIDRGGVESPLWHTWSVAQNYVVPANQTSYLVTGLTPRSRHHFELYAVNAYGNIYYSSLDTYTGPPAPTSLAVHSVSPNENKITWTSNSCTGFSIERKKAGEAYTELATVGGSSREYSDPLALPGTQYFYRVRSWENLNPYNACQKCYSDYSNEMSITTPGQNTSNIVGNPGISGNQIKRPSVTFTLGQNQYQVNGQTLPMDTAPISHEGRTMLPIRYLTEPLGAELGWDAVTQKVSISLNGKTIELKIGENTALVNGKSTMIDLDNPAVVPMISSGRTLLPLSFISENLGCKVQWNPTAQSVSLVSAE